MALILTIIFVLGILVTFIYNKITWSPYSANLDEGSPKYKFKWHKWKAWYPVHVKDSNKIVFNKIILRKAKWTPEDFIIYEYKENNLWTIKNCKN